ncbi:hypothetical protein N7532_000474 [Penicillium argentinense]|uniref:Carboxylic ester hydrolase n=1 Tax=Penicillium argentinense TaxID=1131581 RepID=A0A9W9G5K7_9EURO|nr:uncharacterized protein N7532_000474 [Penicillium argentinense]KAJ5112429.1 hypothetical protein N7532_000474 [Penicillium argentinense]
MRIPLYALMVFSWPTSSQAVRCSEFWIHHDIPGTIIHSIEPAEHRLPEDSMPYCRIVGSVAYGKANNSVGFELWLPSHSAYNERFMVVGNGGFAGTIDTDNMLKQLEQGFAVAGGDSGHRQAKNGNGTTTPGQYIPFLNDVEQTKAWIHDSIAIITISARTITSLFYDRSPRKSYYNGCSTGGAQGFALAQYHPHLFDGIYAGSPGNWYSHLMLSFLWNGRHTKGDAFLDQAILNDTTRKVLDACDELDGVRDGLIENPLRCRFDVNTLVCSSQTAASKQNQACLSPKQLEALKAFYAGPQNPRTHAKIYPGFSLGSEREWLMQETSLYLDYAAPLLQNLVYHNLSYDIDTFDFDRDVAKVNFAAGPFIDETSVDLTSFRQRGGKMIVTQGWTDPYNAPTWPIEHLKHLEQASPSGSVGDFFSLYMVPGGGHCGAAATYSSVPATYHVSDALISWVENGTFPTYIYSTNPPDGSSRTRKLCPWPKTARLRNTGDPDNSESYDCVEA